jgi:predicted O-methyltransferase YrrM
MPVIQEQGEFTRDWTRWKRDNWEKHLIPYQPPIMTMLEIGVHEGRSACWFLDHLLTPADARYIGIDAWDIEQFPQHIYPRTNRSRRKMAKIEQRARRNLTRFGERVVLHKGISADILRSHREEWWNKFDLIYIDGSHKTRECLIDSMQSWLMLKVGGAMVWDDYLMRGRTSVQEAVDEFLVRKEGKHEILWQREQLGVRKIAE